jgi:hypothetical protein
MDLRVARPDALVAAAALAVALLASHAVAEPRALPDTRATVDLDARTWRPVEPAPTGVIAGYTTKAGGALAITKTRIPNPDAWRDKTRDAYVDEVERGIAISVPGYKRTKRVIVAAADTPRRDGTGEAPYVDLEAKTARNTVLIVRVLLYRTYALSLVVEISRAEAANARVAARSLVDAPGRD